MIKHYFPDRPNACWGVSRQNFVPLTDNPTPADNNAGTTVLVQIEDTDQDLYARQALSIPEALELTSMLAYAIVALTEKRADSFSSSADTFFVKATPDGAVRLTLRDCINTPGETVALDLTPGIAHAMIEEIADVCNQQLCAIREFAWPTEPDS